MHAAHKIVGVRRKRLAQQFRIGEHEIRWRNSVGNLFDVEGGLGLGVLVDAFRLRHQPFAPLRGQKIGLLEEIEKLVLRPLRIGKTLVLRFGRSGGRHRLASHTLDRRRPQVEIGAAQVCLQFDRPLGVGQPIFRYMADGLDHVVNVVGHFAFDFAFFARLHIGGERFAAFLDHAGKVVRESLDIDGAGLRRGVGRTIGRLLSRRLRRFVHRFLYGFLRRFGYWLVHTHIVGPQPQELARTALHRKAGFATWFLLGPPPGRAVLALGLTLLRP